MNKWTWTIKRYFTPKAPIETSLQEQWIFSYRNQKEKDRDKKTMLNPQEKPNEKETT